MGVRDRTPDAPRAGAPPGEPPPLSRTLLAVGLLSLAVYVAVMTLFKMSNNDIWIHLKTGEYVLKNGWVPLKDPYSFTASDHDYVAHEWLAGVLFYLVYAPLGVPGLIFFKAAILAASNAVLYLVARILRARLSVMLPAFACMLYISTARYLERPHIFSYLMAAVYLWLFFRFREGGRRRIWLYLLLPAHVLWANLHGGWVQGMAMVATFALGEALVFARAKYLRIGADRALSASDLGLLAALVPGCLIVTLLNPYGYRILTFPFELTNLKLFMVQIYEWQPPFHISYNTSTMFFFYLVQVGFLCASFFLLHRDRSRSRSGGEALGIPNFAILAALAVAFLLLGLFWFQDPPVHWRPEVIEKILQFILALFCLFTVVNLRSVDFTQAGLVALFFLLSLQHNRAVTDSAMATFPILVSAASGLLERRDRERSAAAVRTGPKRGGKAGEDDSAALAQDASRPFVDRSRPVSVVLGSWLLVSVSVFSYQYTYYFDFRGGGREKGFGIADNMPTCAVDFIERHHITGHAFVSYAYAAMLIHRMYPEVHVNMDSRNDVYGEALYREYLGALRDPEGMRAYLQAHDIDFFFMAYGDRAPGTFDYIESTGEWAPVYYDDRSFILLRRKPQYADLIAKLEFKYLKPSVVGTTEIGASNAAQILDEADRCIQNCPTAFLASFFKSKALLYLGRSEEALEVSRDVLKRDPDNVLAYADLGLIYAARNERGKAIEMYETALRINPRFTAARENLKMLRGF